MTLRVTVAMAIFFGCLRAAAPVFAQEVTEFSTPAHISVVDGEATLEREGSIDTATAGMPLGAGDRLRTDAGRAEVLFADASALHIDQASTVDLTDLALLRLIEGRVFLVVAASSTDRYRVDTPVAQIDLHGPGEYRIAILNYLGRQETELAVVRGSASLVNDHGAMPVRAGQRVLAQADRAPSAPMAFNSAAWDAFDRWSEERRSARAGVASNQYLPLEVRGYAGVFDRYGSWSADPTYGYVWYPTVDIGWRPFYNGFWHQGRPWGMTWIGWDPWGWPTHHFGRWGLSHRGSYFWIPARRWSPAWVAWASTPGFYGWCPLGFDGRPLVSVGHFSDFRGRDWVDPWRAWTVASVGGFGVNLPVRQFAVNRGGLPPQTGAFMTHTTPPFNTFTRNRGTDVTATRAIPRTPRTAVTQTPFRGSAASRGRRGVPVAGADPTLPPTAIDPVTPPPYRRAVPRSSEPVESPDDRARVSESRGRRDTAPRRTPQDPPSPTASERPAPPPGPDRQPAVPVRSAPEGRARVPVRPQPRSSIDSWYRSPNPQLSSPYPNQLAAPRVAPYRGNDFARPAPFGPDIRSFRPSQINPAPLQRSAPFVSPYHAPSTPRTAPPRAAPQRSAPSGGARAAQPQAQPGGGGARRR